MDEIGPFTGGQKLLVASVVALLVTLSVIGLGAASVERIVEINQHVVDPRNPAAAAGANLAAEAAAVQFSEDLRGIERELSRLLAIERGLLIIGLVTAAGAAWLAVRAVVRRALGMTDVLPLR
jgi:hypothetical protein